MNIGGLRQSNPAEASRVQSEVREQFQRWFSRGYAATGIEFTAEAGEYLVEPWSHDRV
jgi:predicted GNAT superfamily acetyltransferase